MPEVNFTGAVQFNGSIRRPPRKKVPFYLLPTHLTALIISFLCQHKCIFHLSILTFRAIVNMEVLDQPCSPLQCGRDHGSCETWLLNCKCTSMQIYSLNGLFRHHWLHFHFLNEDDWWVGQWKDLPIVQCRAKNSAVYTGEKRALTSYGLTTCMQVIFRGDSDEELLGKPGRLLTKTLSYAPEHLLFPTQMFYIVERIFPGLKTPHGLINLFTCRQSVFLNAACN